MSNSVSNQLPKPPAVGDRQLALSKRGALAGLEQLKEQLAQWGSPGGERAKLTEALWFVDGHGVPFWDNPHIFWWLFMIFNFIHFRFRARSFLIHSLSQKMEENWLLVVNNYVTVCYCLLFLFFSISGMTIPSDCTMVSGWFETNRQWWIVW